MAYQLPRFAWLHAAADAVAAGGASAITVSVAVNSAAHYSKLHLADGRKRTLMRLAAAQTTFAIDVDRGAGTLEAVDRLIIPAGHNLGATVLAIESSTTGDFSGEETTVGAVIAPGDGVIDVSLTSTTDRYIRLEVTGASAVYELPELVYTRVRQATARGFDPGYTDLLVPRVIEQETAADHIAIHFAAPRSEISASVEWLDGSDLGFFDELMAVAAARRPIWYWRHDSAAVPIYCMVNVTARKQASPNPGGTGELWTFDVDLRELPDGPA